MISNGIDLVKVNRFDDLKNNSTFMNNTFTESEMKYIEKTQYNNSTIAGLFAAKEAFLKAIDMGINNSLLDIEIIHDNNNSPSIKLNGELKKTYSNIKNISLSISHDEEYAIAMVILLK